MSPRHVDSTTLVDAPRRRRIAAAATCDERTVLRAYRGQPVKESTRLRVTEAARSLGLPEPPDASARVADRRRS